MDAQDVVAIMSKVSWEVGATDKESEVEERRLEKRRHEEGREEKRRNADSGIPANLLFITVHFE